jgi:hypothetical protein
LFQNVSQPQRDWRWERYCNPALKTNPIDRQPKAQMQPKLLCKAESGAQKLAEGMASMLNGQLDTVATRGGGV